MLTSSDFSNPFISIGNNILPILLKVLLALNLGTHVHYKPFSLTVLLLFIQVIRGLYQSELWEESWILWRGVTWVAIVPVVWLYCFFPFPCLPPNHFPKTKEYKTANAFTTHWRRQGELCRLHYLFTVETGISLNETAVSIPPWSHCGGLQSQSLSLSRSSTSSIYYHPTLPGDTTAPSLNSLQRKGASLGLDGSRRFSTGISSNRYQGMCCFTQLLHNNHVHTASQTGRFGWHGCTIRARNSGTTKQTQGL